METLLRVEGLTIGYADLVVAEDISVELAAGELVCLLGPNGAGKSTLMRTLAGMQKALGGRVLLDGEDVHGMPARERARRLAVVLTEIVHPGLFSAYDLVALGRYPHTGWTGVLGADDHAAVREALASVGALDLARRAVADLSDGERQKVMIARALAQEPRLLVLDEITAFLDLPRRVEVMRLLRHLAHSSGRAVLVSSHDLDLALRSADRLWLLPSGGTIEAGAPEDLVLSGAFEAVFAAEGVVFDRMEGSFHVHRDSRGEVELRGEGVELLWTRRALERQGLRVAEDGGHHDVRVEVRSGEGRTTWSLVRGDRSDEYGSLYELTLDLRGSVAPSPGSGSSRWPSLPCTADAIRRPRTPDAAAISWPKKEDPVGRRKKKRIERQPPAAAAPEKRKPARPPRLSRGKRLVFHAVTVVLFFGLLELVLALFGVRPVVVEEDPYVGFASEIKLFEKKPSGVYETASNKLSLFNEQSFPVKKKRGTFRIFTLGGSCTYGRPFEDSTSWSGWLRAYLPAVDSSRRWEVVNAGGISYASYRVAKLMEELVEYDPDLFIVYSGHNEFLEKRTYSGLIEEPEALTCTKLLLQKSRIWALGRAIVERRRRRAAERYQLTGEVQELLDTSVGLDYYFRDEPFKRQVLDHYRFNLRRMVSLARSAGARVVFVTLPVNEKDMSPFKSQHRDGLSEAERTRDEELLARASEALGQGRPEEARDLTSEALAIDGSYADGHYLNGRALLALGRFDEADAAFDRAIEEDVCPLRALEETNRIIAETAAETGTPLVDYRRLLDERMREIAGHTILGDELFLDHAHVTVEANGILARALVETLGQMGIADLEGGALARADGPVSAEVLARVDAEAQARAYKNLSKLLLWAGKKDEAGKYARLASETLGDDWEVRYNEGVVELEAKRYDEAIASFEESVRLDPERAAAHDQLGRAYAAAGRPQEAIAAGEKAVELDPEMAEAWNNLGTYYGAAGEQDRALEATQKALALRPDYAEAHNNLGKVRFDRGELDLALASFERAVALRPKYAEAIANRGLVLGEMGRFDEAARAFTSALELDPRLVSAHVGKGQALLAAGDPAAAVPSFEAAIAIDPHNVEAYEALAASLMTSGEAERAWEVMKDGLAKNPDTPAAARLYRLYGRSLAQEGSFDDAVSSFQKAVELDPDLLAAWVDLGNLYMVRGKSEDAIRTYREALAHHEGDDGLHHILATALLIGGQYEEGRVQLERALEINPKNAAVANDLAKVYERLGRKREALELYRRAARLDPSLDQARAGADRLGSEAMR